MQFTKIIEGEVHKEINKITGMILDDKEPHTSYRGVLDYWERAKSGDVSIRSEKMKEWGCTALEYRTGVNTIYCKLLSAYVKYAHKQGNRRTIPR